MTTEGVVVVDALGSPELARKLLQEIRKITKKPIHTVVLTHYHADHIYGLQVFKEAGARIVAHAAARGREGQPRRVAHPGPGRGAASGGAVRAGPGLP